MKSIDFAKASYLRSCLSEDSFPSIYASRGVLAPEVAIVGRSNAGKSSLINHLTQKKDLAHTSATPGKTQMINFYLIDDRLLLVDLPGYGFAKTGKTLKKEWASHLSNYLDSRKQLVLILLILDIRRELSEEDKRFIEWAQFHKRPLCFIFSKADKLTTAQRLQSEKALTEMIRSFYQDSFFAHLSYSIKETPCRLFLKQQIESFLSPKSGPHGTD